MALKDDVRTTARDLRQLSVEAGEILLDQGYGVLTQTINEIASRVDTIANLIPSPEQARALQVPDGYKLVYVGDDVDAEVVDGDDSMLTANANLHTGEYVGRRDRNGTPLRVGDAVRVYNSDRYGNPQAVVRGPGPDFGDGKERVHVALANGENEGYTPSTGRVEQITALKAIADAVNGNGDGEETVSVLEIQFTPRGLRIREVREPSGLFSVQ